MIFETIDIEATKLPKSEPWIQGAYLCSIGMETGDTSKDAEYLHDTSTVWCFNHVSEPIRDHSEMLKEIQSRIDKADFLVFHNAKFDLAWLLHAGIKWDSKPIYCTMIGEYLLYGQNPDVSLKLNSCCARRNMGSKIDLMAQFWDEGFETDEIPWDVHNEYLRQDVHLTKKLFLDQHKAIKKAKLTKVASVTFDVCKILTHMEYNGVEFDLKGAKKYVEEYDAKLALLDEELVKIAGIKFYPGSPTQLAAVMYGGKLKKKIKALVAKQRKDGTYRVSTRNEEIFVPVKGLGFIPHESTLSDKTGQYSTGKKARLLIHCDTQQQRDFFNVLDERANAQKAYSTLISDRNDSSGLIRKIGTDGRVHPTFNQTTVRTGRLSSSNPNGQNLPRGTTSPIKKLFLASPGDNFIINCDLSQIEWRTAAGLSQDETMCDEVRHGFDTHTFAAQEWFGGKDLDRDSPEFKAKRQSAKTFNFRMIYNGTAQSFYNDGAMPPYSLEQYKDIVDKFWKKYSGLRKWQKKNEKLVKKNGYIRNVSGRILTFAYNENPDKGPIGYNFNAICNYPVQSISADCIFLAMREIWNRVQAKGLKAKLVLQVHDSVVWDAPREEVYDICKICGEVFSSLRELVKDYYGWDVNVPLTGEISFGKNYGTQCKGFLPDAITKEFIEEKLSEFIDK